MNTVYLTAYRIARKHWLNVIRGYREDRRTLEFSQQPSFGVYWSAVHHLVTLRAWARSQP